MNPSSKSIVSKGATLIGLIAISIGLLGNICPTIFLKVPNIGYLLWAITGNPMPPYFSTAPWEDHLSWLRDGDVVIAASLKSGSTWMQYCTHQIRTKGADNADDLWSDVGLASPLMEMIHAPGLSWEITREKFNTTVLQDGSMFKDHWDNPTYPFRIFKSHYRPMSETTINDPKGVLPVKERNKVKFVVITRRGLDILASAIHFFDQHSDVFRKTWGGCPPKSSGVFEEDAQARLSDFLPGGLLSDQYFTWLNSWWKMKGEPNVLLLHYEDAKTDLSGVIQKIADFVGIELSETEFATVLERCSWDHMKAISHEKFQYKLPLHPDGINAMEKGAMIRNGQIGEGLHVYNEEQQKQWADEEEKQFLDKDLLVWSRGGGKST